MEKIVVNVPRGVRFLSEWKDFRLPTIPTIINKRLTGCGFTEYCITNSDNVILVSPRKILLENKFEQHAGDKRILHVKNECESTSYDKELSSGKSESEKEIPAEDAEKIMDMRNKIMNHYLEVPPTVGCKYLVTYDSFRHVREVLGDRIANFYVVVDEWQSIFVDVKFKPDTENEFLTALQGIDKLCFVSATPMLDKYLEMIDEFKDLPFIELDWEAEDPIRVIKPQINPYSCKSVIATASGIIKDYREGRFEVSAGYNDAGNPIEVESREAVIYVNSVRSICEIIKKNYLVPSECNVLCARTPENEKKLHAAFNFVIKYVNETDSTEEKIKLIQPKESCLGKVPVRGEPHKMFTLCTRTVYLGADFYSTCARTFILSSCDADSLTCDISLDLLQIAGRQRLLENPWKNRVEFYYKLSNDTEGDAEKRLKKIEKKKSSTDSLLKAYRSSELSDCDKHALAEKYLKEVKTGNYKDDYVAVNKHGGNDLLPVFNKLVMISDIRESDLMHYYREEGSVFSEVSGAGFDISATKVDNLIDRFNACSFFSDKMRLLCEAELTYSELSIVLERVPMTFKNFYLVLGPTKCKALSYQRSHLIAEYNNIFLRRGSSLVDTIKSSFELGAKYTRAEIKETLRDIYKGANLTAAPKATDICNWFEVEECYIANKSTGKRDKGFIILEIKEKD